MSANESSVETVNVTASLSGQRRPLPAGPIAAIILTLIAALLTLSLGTNRLSAWILIALVPGLALLPFVPGAAKRTLAMCLVAVVTASLAAWVVLIPAISLAGIGIGEGQVYASAICFSLASLVAGLLWEPPSMGVSLDILDLLGLVAVVAAAGIVANAMWSDPPLGSDWGHYWHFADSIRDTGSLSTINRNWMTGDFRFADYSGLPGLLAAWLGVAGGRASGTPGLACALSAVGACSAWLAVRCWWSRAAAVTAGLGMLLIPTSLSLIAWSGLATQLSLVFFLPLMAVTLLPAQPDPGSRFAVAGAMAVLLAALVASHPITALIAFAATALITLARLARSGRSGVRPCVEAVILTAALSLPAAVEYKMRIGSLGGVQGYRSYLETRLDWLDIVERGYAPSLLIVLGSVGLLAAWQLRAGRRFVGNITAALVAAFAYANVWLAHVPGDYRRPLYIICPLLALGLGGIMELRRSLGSLIPVATSVLGIAGLAVGASLWIPNLRNYYSGLDQEDRLELATVSAQTTASQSLVADGCTAFPALGLTDARVYGALRPAYIGAKAEAIPAAQAREILRGGPAGQALARQLRVEWILRDRECPGEILGADERALPAGFEAVYRGRRLMVARRQSDVPALGPN